MLHYIHAAITDSREMPTRIAITFDVLITLLEDHSVWRSSCQDLCG